MRYGLGNNIYDLASLMVSRHGSFSKEALSGIFTLIFSWNRDYYLPPRGTRKSINVLDEHVAELERTIESLKGHILALQEVRLENVNFQEKLQDLTVGDTILHLFSQLRFLGPTGASKVLHLLLPNLIVLWDTQIREDYQVDSGADSFLQFQKMMKQLLDYAITDYMNKHNVGKENAIQGILTTRYGIKTKSPAKLLDEYNWATRGNNKRHLVNGV